MYVLSITNPRRPGVSYRGRSGFVTRVGDAATYGNLNEALDAGSALRGNVSLDDVLAAEPVARQWPDDSWGSSEEFLKACQEAFDTLSSNERPPLWSCGAWSIKRVDVSTDLKPDGHPGN